MSKRTKKPVMPRTAEGKIRVTIPREERARLCREAVAVKEVPDYLMASAPIGVIGVPVLNRATNEVTYVASKAHPQACDCKGGCDRCD
jgi:hypothetical protein